MTAQPDFYCDKCLEPVMPISEPDDIGNRTYECQKCKTQTTTPRTKEQRDRSWALREQIAKETTPEALQKFKEESEAKNRERIQQERKLQEQIEKPKEKRITVDNDELNDYLADGWKVVKQYKDNAIIAKKPEKDENQQNESLSQKVYTLFIDSESEVFRDQYGAGFARIRDTTTDDMYDINDKCTVESTPSFCKEGGKTSENTPPSPDGKQTVTIVHTVTEYYRNIKLTSKEAKQYLAHLLYEAEGKIINTDTISQVINLLEYEASKSKAYPLSNRIARAKDGSIWIDTADPANRAYHITKEGWTLVESTDVPICFRRFKHQLPMAKAVKGGDPKKLLPYVNIGTNSDSERSKRRQLLLLVQTISYGIPNISHPINVMYGCPGSHKSTAQEFIRRTYDPSCVLKIKSLPRTDTDLMQILDHHYMPIFDNLSYMPEWVSDTLCCSVTGAGMESRELFTTDDSFIRSFKRCILLNGVNLTTRKGDLINRSILHETEPSLSRRTDEELNTEFEKDLPEILGGFFDVLVKALQLEGTITPPKDFRLLDFTKWGCVIANALGSTTEEFIKAMEENLEDQTEADIENNTVADVFLQFFGGSIEYAGNTIDNPIKMTPDTLYNNITVKAISLGVNTKSKTWPSAANAFSRKLNNSRISIMSHGWNYENDHTTKSRIISIWRTDQPPKEKENPPQQAITQEAIQQTLNQLHMLRSQYGDMIPICQVDNKISLSALLKQETVINVDDKHVRLV
jgi:hypothetical protein